MLDSLCILLDGDVSLKPGWQSKAVAPKAPGNYKDPEKISEYVSKKMATLDQDLLGVAHHLCDVANVRVAIPNYFLECNIWEPFPDAAPEKAITAVLRWYYSEGDEVKYPIFVFGKYSQTILRNLFETPASVKFKDHVDKEDATDGLPMYCSHCSYDDYEYDYSFARSRILWGGDFVYKSVASLAYTREERELMMPPAELGCQSWSDFDKDIPSMIEKLDAIGLCAKDQWTVYNGSNTASVSIIQKEKQIVVLDEAADPEAEDG